MKLWNYNTILTEPQLQLLQIVAQMLPFSESEKIGGSNSSKQILSASLLPGLLYLCGYNLFGSSACALPASRVVDTLVWRAARV